MTIGSSDTYHKVIDIVAHTLSVERANLTPESSFEDLGADSLDMVEVIMKLEETFDIEIDDEQAAQIKTIGEAVKSIEALKAH